MLLDSENGPTPTIEINRAQRLACVFLALEECGADPHFTAGLGITRYVNENWKRDFTLPHTNFGIKHDLCHLFMDSVGGLYRHESRVLGMQTFMFPSSLRRQYSSDPYVDQRSKIIASLYETLFAESLSEAPHDFLKNVPLEALGLKHETMNARTRYSLTGAADRQKFLEAYARICAEQGIYIEIRTGALAEAPAKLPKWRASAQQDAHEHPHYDGF